MLICPAIYSVSAYCRTIELNPQKFWSDLFRQPVHIKVVIDSWNLTPWVEALSHNGFNSNVQTVTTQLVLLWQQYKSLLFRKQTRENSPNVRITSGNSTTNPFFSEIKHEKFKNLHASVTFFFLLELPLWCKKISFIMSAVATRVKVTTWKRKKRVRYS